MDLGRTAVLQIGNIDLVAAVMHRGSANPFCYRAFGIEPSAYRMVMTKSATQYKELYGKFSTLFYPTDTPGGSSANLTALPFEHLPRPFWPFDKIDTFDDTAVFARGK